MTADNAMDPLDAILASPPGPASLAAAKAKAERIAARNARVEANQGLVRSVALQYCGRGVDLDDLISLGQFGLMEAAEVYDPSRGAFSTIATFLIRRSIGRGLASLWNPEGRGSSGAQGLNVVDPASACPLETLAEGDERRRVRAAVQSLPERQRLVVELRFGFATGEGLEWAGVGERLGITRQRAHQIGAKALGKLRGPLASHGG
jgi:RNA polymerase sigma factor (sigma-70 family)